MLQDVSRPLTRQIEITMLRQIDGSRFVRSGLIIEDQFILFAKRVGDFHFQVARIAFFAVFACICEGDTLSSFVFERLGCPYHFVKSL